MRQLLLFIQIFTISISARGQKIKTISNSVESIYDIESANEFLESHADWNAKILEPSDCDSLTFNHLISTEKISIIDNGKSKSVIKPIIIDEGLELRASYIYLDGKTLNLTQIDSLREVIITQYNSGISFAKLAYNYSMDGNSQNGGDLGWFPSGRMVESFENTIESHKQSEIFTLDVPSNDGYYVILKTHSERIRKKYALLKVTGS